MEEQSLEAGLLKNSKSTTYQNGESSSSDFSLERTTCSVTPGILLSTFVAVCGSFSFGCSVSLISILMGYSSPAQSGITRDLNLSLQQYSFFSSVMTFGGMISAVFSGKIASLIGRKRTMCFSEIFCTMGWLGVAFAEDELLLNVGRFFLGFGVGFISYVIPVYIAETTPKNIRGSFTFTNQLMQTFGFSFVFLIGNVVNWRTLALISAIPCGMQVIGLFFIPESPRWLAEVGKQKELEAALHGLRGKNADISQEAAEITEIAETFRRESKSGILSLFQRRYAHSLIVGVGLMFLQQFGGSSAVTSYAKFSSDVGSTMLAILMIPKTLVVLLLVDKWGRRPLLMISAVGMCLFCFLLGLAFWLQAMKHLEELTSILAFTSVLGYLIAFAIGMGGLPWLIMSEIYPIHIKVPAGTLVTMSNWFFGWIVVYTFNFMLKWSSSGTFFVFSGICGATIMFVWMLVPETKGRTLEEIQASFSDFQLT
ncbi:sugar transporter ERD6-like 2 isoform X3 [Carica papaya]|uniref:sugar transporter ERD6-like 2 isoform X3 n=1 Tax=Carica papaya TaxID=3649 RepID=UPI000B8C8D1E|nr:sugar transporter ERD6-like 2 isoform X3 [Carica papaya]